MKNKFLIGALLFTIFFSWTCTNNPSPAVLPNQDLVLYGTPFLHVPATEDIVMYEINPGAFSLSGDFNGITARLDHLVRPIV